METNRLTETLARVETLASEPASGWEELLELSSSEDGEVRMRALEALVPVQRGEVAQRAAAALSDPDALVRMAAIELIEEQQLSDFAAVVWSLAQTDVDEVVRQTAMLALVQLGPVPDDANVLDYVTHADGPARVAACYLLVKRGRREWLFPLLEGLFDPVYTTRALTLTLVDGLLQSQEVPFFLQLLQLLHEREDSGAVRLRIAELLQLPTLSSEKLLGPVKIGAE